MKKIIGALCVLAGFGIAVPAAQADSPAGPGICKEGMLGVNSSTGQALINYESPQRGAPANLLRWVGNARVGNPTINRTWTILGDQSVTANSGYSHCRIDGSWNHNVLGTGTDYYVLSVWVSWNRVATNLFRPVSYGTYNAASYWHSDVNGANSTFHVTMPWGGDSNWSSSPPA